ncbi:hypothetical protein [Pleomorphomonas carboxyditropha]|nr:hypothetical protein [Pleomorphomonas carboxyditropha]
MSTQMKRKSEGGYGRNLEYPEMSEEERRQSWEAIQKLWAQGGFRSDGPYPKRDELYDEMTSEHVR